MISILKREIGDYFNGPMGYVFSAFLLLFAGIYVTVFNFRQGYANFEYVLSYLSFLLIFAVPLLTMRTFAEERRQRTEQLLFSLPVSAAQIVIGKFLALALVISLPTAIIALYPLILTALGQVNLAVAYSTLLAFFFLALLLTAIGMLISSLCENPVAAAGLCFAVLLVLYYAESFSSYVTASVSGTLLIFGIFAAAAGVLVWRSSKSIRAGILTAVAGEGICLICATLRSAEFSQLLVLGMRRLAVFNQFFSFVDGVLDFRLLYYDFSVTVFLLFLTVRVLEERRWNG